MAFTHSPKIVTDGLILAVDAANIKSYVSGSTVWSDISGNSRNLTLVSGSSYNTSSLGVVRFDGTNDHALLPAPSPFAGTQQFTAEFWVNFTSITGTFGPSISKGAWLFAGGTGAGGNQPEFGVFSLNTTSFTPDRISFGNGGGNNVGSLSINVSTLIQTGSWYQLVLTRPSSNVQFVYLNGTLIGSGSIQNSFVSGITAFGGLPGQSDYSSYLNANVGKIMVYNKALTAQEVLQNFNTTRGRFGV